MAGMKFTTLNGCLILQNMEKSSPGARIPQWHSQLSGSWLIKVSDTVIVTREDVVNTLKQMVAARSQTCHLLLNTGMPQANID